MKLKRFILRVNQEFLKNCQLSFIDFNKDKRISINDYYKALREYAKHKRLKTNFGIIARYIAQNIDSEIDELKYLYVTEQSQKLRIHHHLVVNFEFCEVQKRQFLHYVKPRKTVYVYRSR